MVVFRIQQEICAHNCHTNSDNDQDNKYKKHKTIDIVDLRNNKNQGQQPNTNVKHII